VTQFPLADIHQLQAGRYDITSAGGRSGICYLHGDKTQEQSDNTKAQGPNTNTDKECIFVIYADKLKKKQNPRTSF